MADCPGNNEVGIRANPVCVDGVDTSRFDNVENDFTLQAVRKTLCIYIFCHYLLEIKEYVCDEF